MYFEEIRSSQKSKILYSWGFPLLIQMKITHYSSLYIKISPYLHIRYYGLISLKIQTAIYLQLTEKI